MEEVKIEGQPTTDQELQPPTSQSSTSKKRDGGKGFGKKATTFDDDQKHLLKVLKTREHTNPTLPIEILMVPSSIAQSDGTTRSNGYRDIGFIAGINQVSGADMTALKSGYADLFDQGYLEDLGAQPFALRPVGEQRLLVQNTEDVELLLDWRSCTTSQLVQSDINRIFAGIEALAEFAEAV